MTATEYVKKALKQKKKDNPKKYADAGKKPPKPVTNKSKRG